VPADSALSVRAASLQFQEVEFGLTPLEWLGKNHQAEESEMQDQDSRVQLVRPVVAPQSA